MKYLVKQNPLRSQFLCEISSTGTKMSVYCEPIHLEQKWSKCVTVLLPSRLYFGWPTSW